MHHVLISLIQKLHRSFEESFMHYYFRASNNAEEARKATSHRVRVTLHVHPVGGGVSPELAIESD